MSSRNPIDWRQDRRQWLKTSATVLGATVVPLPAITAEAQQELAKPIAPPPHPHEERVAHFFTPAQHATVEELTETIIPADSHSGGAKAAKVADYIDQVLRQSTDESRRELWREGLRLVDVMTQHYHGKTFLDASPEDRAAVLTVLSDNSHMIDLPEVRFFNDAKRITVIGYYTTKIGIHDELQYKGNRILKDYVGCEDQGAAKS